MSVHLHVHTSNDYPNDPELCLHLLVQPVVVVVLERILLVPVPMVQLVSG
jgi:hypothetical protein